MFIKATILSRKGMNIDDFNIRFSRFYKSTNAKKWNAKVF
jgi:hypothetical protein